jgi:hypothetical protein
MFPPEVPANSPGSERRIFDLLKRDPATDDWQVLHSLGLQRTQIGPYGEIDFVVLVPGKGICCLEIKGGEVSCANGVWHTFNRRTQVRDRLGKSPYLQAREGMFQLRRAIEAHFGAGHPAARCPSSYAVVFPDVDAPPATPEVEPWETIDIRSLGRPISGLIERNIAKTREKLSSSFGPDCVSLGTLTQIRKFLRPDFERVIARSTSIARTEERLIALTEEQYDYLDIAATNSRSLVIGAAGTGKTLLALEHARREAEAGRTVLLLCFNRILGEWLGLQVERATNSWIVARTFHSFLRMVIGQSTYAAEFEERSKLVGQRELFSEVLPFFGELAIAEAGTSFDTLVIDEAQDLLCREHLSLFNALLRGGMSGGRWAIFGDFTRQAIYGNEGGVDGDVRAEALLKEFVPFFPVLPLKTNCRNTPQIGEETALLSGFDSLPYRLSNVDGLPVDYRFWRTQVDEIAQLEKAIGMLLDEGVSVSDIVVLAPVRLENSAASRLNSKLPVIFEIRDVRNPNANGIGFSTVHAFKGMESPVVVLCGFAEASSEERRALLYTGMSRARSHLVMVLSEKFKTFLPSLLSKRLHEQWKS